VRAVAAWAAAVNATGGLNCHPVKYIIEDDGGDPSRNQALTQQLVEQDHVIALVHVDAPLAGQGAVNYLTQRGVPAIGSEAGSAWFYTSPVYFPQVSSGDLDFESAFGTIRDLFVPKGQTAVGTVSCVEVGECSRLYTLAPNYAPRFGVNIVYRGQVSVAQPDYTSACQAAHSAGAQVVYVALDPNGIARLARSCNSVNYHPQFVTTNLAAPVSLASEPLLNGMAVSQVTMPWMVTSSPAIVEYQRVLKQFAPGQPPDSSSMLGWASAQLFQAAARAVSDPPTSQSILSGLWSMKNVDLGGITAPLTFTKSQNAPMVFCYWSTQIQNGQFVSPNNGHRTCE
jgi:branched-chain amino acid transport system substrate-binding protein